MSADTIPALYVFMACIGMAFLFTLTKAHKCGLLALSSCSVDLLW